MGMAPTPPGARPAMGTPWWQAILDPAVHALYMSLLPEEQLSRREHHYLKGLLFQLIDDGAAPDRRAS